MSRFALIDGNTFFVSCQRVFEPKLNGRPVVVLSNNDGCIIALSNEAKALGIKMTQPAFEVRHILNQHNVAIFSGNLELYCDMSTRMMACLSKFAPRMEVYSIDEAFLDVSHVPPDDLDALGCCIKKEIWRNIGIPVCVGFGHTKTLAKIANRFAKKIPELSGVYNYDVHKSPANLGFIDIDDVWGIGRSYAHFLKGCGIRNAFDFVEADPAFIRKTMSVVGARIQRELKGISCLPLQTEPQIKKSLAVTRSLNHPTRVFEDVRESVATRLVRACEKLRSHGLVAQELTVFITTKKHTKPRPYNGVASYRFSHPTAQTTCCLKAALKLVDHVFKPGFTYKKTGVIFSGLIPESAVTRDLFSDLDSRDSYEKVDKVADKKRQKAVDALNLRYGRHTVIYGATGVKRPWQPLLQQCSPRYTTRIDEILMV